MDVVNAPDVPSCFIIMFCKYIYLFITTTVNITEWVLCFHVRCSTYSLRFARTDTAPDNCACVAMKNVIKWRYNSHISCLFYSSPKKNV